MVVTEKSISIVEKQLTAALKIVAKRNPRLLDFIADFKGGKGVSISNRWEIWFQIELLSALSQIVNSHDDLFHEVRFPYKMSKAKAKGKSKHGFSTGAIDLAFRPKGGDSGLLAAIELKVKSNPTQAIKGGLHDLLKPQAFITRGWNFRAVYAVCVFVETKYEESDSKYVKFANEYGTIIPFGKRCKAAIIGWNSDGIRSKTNSDRYKEYSSWNKGLLELAKGAGLTINKATANAAQRTKLA